MRNSFSYETPANRHVLAWSKKGLRRQAGLSCYQWMTSQPWEEPLGKTCKSLGKELVVIITLNNHYWNDLLSRQQNHGRTSCATCERKSEHYAVKAYSWGSDKAQSWGLWASGPFGWKDCNHSCKGSKTREGWGFDSHTINSWTSGVQDFSAKYDTIASQPMTSQSSMI